MVPSAEKSEGVWKEEVATRSVPALVPFSSAFAFKMLRPRLGID